MKPEETYKLIIDEWDEIALERYNDLVNNNDISYNEILKPNLLELLKTHNLSSILDIGCGVGVFTEELGKFAQNIRAIDISKRSIKIAKEFSSNSNIEYQFINFFDFTSQNKFSTVISNMTLMTMPDIKDLFVKVKGLLDQNGAFIFTITHPSFWPIYWGYNSENFNYNKEIEIVTDFKTRSKIYVNYKTRHYHRPLEYYIRLILSSGLTISKFLELRNNNEEVWYPRFLLVECKNNSSLKS